MKNSLDAVIRDELREPPFITRVIPLEEVRAREYYEDMADLAVIFNHEIVEMGHIWRWRPNRLFYLLHDYCPVYLPSAAENRAQGGSGYDSFSQSTRASICLNELIADVYDGLCSVEEYMKFYMQLGYSLSGFSEVFGQRNAYEFNLPDAKRTPSPGQDPDGYIETVLEYMRRVHAGKVLKL